MMWITSHPIPFYSLPLNFFRFIFGDLGATAISAMLCRLVLLGQLPPLFTLFDLAYRYRRIAPRASWMFADNSGYGVAHRTTNGREHESSSVSTDIESCPDSEPHMILGAIGILLSLIVLITLAYRGHTVIAVAPIAAAIAVLFSGAPMLASYTQIFMPALGKFIVDFFPLFLAGAIFGRLMTVSGYAEDIARWIPRVVGPKRAILVTSVVTALLTYGGVSAWVIAFTIVPIAKPLFRYANTSMRLMPAAIALGIFTFATAALPGSPQIHNAIPTRFFGTTTFAAPLLGIFGAIVTFGLGLGWLAWRERRIRAAGENFEDLSLINAQAAKGNLDKRASVRHGATHKDDITPDGTKASNDPGLPVATTTADVDSNEQPEGSTVRGLIGLIPILTVMIVNALFVYKIAPLLNTS